MTFSFIVNFDNTCILARCVTFNFGQFFSYFFTFPSQISYIHEWVDKAQQECFSLVFWKSENRSWEKDNNYEIICALQK